MRRWNHHALIAAAINSTTFHAKPETLIRSHRNRIEEQHTGRHHQHEAGDGPRQYACAHLGDGNVVERHTEQTQIDDRERADEETDGEHVHGFDQRIYVQGFVERDAPRRGRQPFGHFKQ